MNRPYQFCPSYLLLPLASNPLKISSPPFLIRPRRRRMLRLRGKRTRPRRVCPFSSAENSAPNYTSYAFSPFQSYTVLIENSNTPTFPLGQASFHRKRKSKDSHHVPEDSKSASNLPIPTFTPSRPLNVFFHQSFLFSPLIMNRRNHQTWPLQLCCQFLSFSL